MKPCRSYLLLGALLILGCGQGTRKQPLEVTYIANEGFMLRMGSTKVLVDALPKSQYYVNPSDSMVANLMDGIPPFDNVDYVFVTHDHPDHFNAEMMSRFLRRHPSVRLIANPATCGALLADSSSNLQRTEVGLERGTRRLIRGEKADVLVLRLDHGGFGDVRNLGYLVRSNGCTFFHVGDARLSDNQEYLRTVDWGSYDVDLLFIEFFDHSSETREIIEKLIKPKYVILMHIPTGEEEKVRNENEKVHPRTMVFGNEGEMKRFDTSVNSGSVN